AAGLKEARGEFVAFFDGDAVPEVDFLRKTIPHFAEARVAVVQTRLGHLNREFSLLTIAQALGIDGHFAVEQPARFWGNLFLTVILLSVPLLGAKEIAPEGNAILDVSLAFGLGVLGPGFLLVYAQWVLDPGWLRRAWRIPTIMIIGVGVAWSTSLAVLDALRR